MLSSALDACAGPDPIAPPQMVRGSVPYDLRAKGAFDSAAAEINGSLVISKSVIANSVIAMSSNAAYIKVFRRARQIGDLRIAPIAPLRNFAKTAADRRCRDSLGRMP
jgi:hypothetical protein